MSMNAAPEKARQRAFLKNLSLPALAVLLFCALAAGGTWLHFLERGEFWGMIAATTTIVSNILIAYFAWLALGTWRRQVDYVGNKELAAELLRLGKLEFVRSLSLQERIREIAISMEGKRLVLRPVSDDLIAAISTELEKPNIDTLSYFACGQRARAAFGETVGNHADAIGEIQALLKDECDTIKRNSDFVAISMDLSGSAPDPSDEHMQKLLQPKETSLKKLAGTDAAFQADLYDRFIRFNNSVSELL